MKIFYITTTVHVSKEMADALGGSTHTFYEAKELVRNGNEVHIISKRYANDRNYEVIDGVHIHRLKRGLVVSGERIEKKKWKSIFKPLKCFSNIVLAYQVNKLVDRYGCDIILERGQSLGVGAWLSIITGVPLVLEAIDHIYSRISLLKAKAIIAYTDVFFRGRDKKKVVKVTSGFDRDIFYPEIVRSEYDICYTGSFKEWDGIQDLVKAVKKLVDKEDMEDLKVVLVGDGVIFKEVVEMINKLGLNNNFDLTGKVEIREVRKYINKSKICVAPYNIKLSNRGKFDKYGFYFSPLKIFEYMGCGKPVVASDYKIIKNTLNDKNGALYPAGNVNKLAKELKYLLAERDLLRIENINVAESRKYTWEKVVKDIDGVLKSSKK